MTITLSSKKQLNASVDRLRAECESLGIRLGKDSDKAQKLVCAVLNQPNWHHATANVEKSAEQSHLDLMKDECDKLLNEPLFDGVSEKSLLKSSLLEFKKMDSFYEVIASLPSVVSLLEMTTGHLLNKVNGELLTVEEAMVTRMNAQFAINMLATFDGILPKSIESSLVEFLKSIDS